MSIVNGRVAGRTVLVAAVVAAMLTGVGPAHAGGAGVPRAGDDSLTVAPGGTGTVTVLANDTSVDAIASVALEGQPEHGIASFDGDHVLTYTALAGYHGGDWVFYTVTDADGDEAYANVSVTVVAGNPVTLRAQMASTQVNAGVDIFVVDDDSVPDGFGSLSINGDGPANGDVTVAGSTIRYVPNGGFQGADYFYVLVSDLDGDSSSASVEVRVHDGLDVDAQPDEVQVAETVDIDVLANDALGDLPVVLATYLSSSHVAGAALTVVDQRIRYRMPETGFRGWDYFGYTLTDANGDTEGAYVGVLVHGGAHAVVVADDEFTVPSTVSSSLDVLANDSVLDDPLQIEILAQPYGGSASVSGRTISYHPSTGTRSDWLQYRVADADGDTAIGSVMLTVDATPAPTATPPPPPPPATAAGPVTPTLTAGLSASAVPRKAPARITGSVTPSSAVTLTLRRKSGTSWTTVTSVSPTPTGAYSLMLPTGTTGLSTYSVTASGAGIVTVTSAEKSLAVFGAGVASVKPGRAESVRLENTGRVPIALGGMTLKDTSGKTLVLPRFALGVGKSVTVYTGKGRSTATKLFVGKGKSVDVWSTHDVARLLTARGVLAARLKY